MDTEIAQLLGIDPKGCDKGMIGGVGGDRPGFLHAVGIQIEGFESVLDFRVLFVDDLHSNFDVILGQQDFFRNFNVNFERSKGVFSLEHVH